VKPVIDSTRFGSITIDGKTYDHDVLIRLNGTVHKRKKKLSKQVYGTSHTVSLQEAEHVYQPGTEMLLVGAGKFNRVKLSDQAASFFEQRQVRVKLLPTSKACKEWNQLQGNVIGLFHITC
jgi:hypothetical protein